MADDIEARWALVLPHREHMLNVARRRCPSQEDAEDCVHEAMLRVAEFDRLEPERVGALLTSVTVRLAVDMHRARERARRHLPRLVSVPAQHQPPDEAVLDSDQARWLAAQLERLPERERDVLRERAAGYSMGEAAARLSLSYKAVESAFTRGRLRMRAWAGAGVLLVAEYLRRLRQRPATVYASMAMLSAGCLVLSSMPPSTDAPRHHGRVPTAIVPAPAWLDSAAAVAPPLLARAAQQAAGAAPAAASVRRTAAEAPAAARRSANPTISQMYLGIGGQAYEITVVGYTPPGPGGRALGCVEQFELVHRDGTVGCPPQ
ncbi:MAG TPA: sigma-70 family RNA polymerase sigma factor [Candidatus Angelobacter sp.]|jgi:RNA polymerase sigma factor (sigma-70 family)|nr:sigma-70 family RNA polymerase sigma factor [Candidatus Angelobacter sp.]